MYQKLTRQGTVVSLKVTTPFTTAEVIESIQRTDILPAGYYVESATISEVRTTKLVRRIPQGQDEFWNEIPEPRKW